MTLEERIGDSATPTFVKKITEGGQAQNLGVKVGDKIFKVKGRDAVSHANVVAGLKHRDERVEVTFLREEE